MPTSSSSAGDSTRELCRFADLCEVHPANCGSPQGGCLLAQHLVCVTLQYRASEFASELMPETNHIRTELVGRESEPARSSTIGTSETEPVGLADSLCSSALSTSLRLCLVTFGRVPMSDSAATLEIE